MNRRSFLASAAALGIVRPAQAQAFEITMTEAEWRSRLTPAQYAVLREADTERSGSSPLDAEKRAGVFACAGRTMPKAAAEARKERRFIGVSCLVDNLQLKRIAPQGSFMLPTPPPSPCSPRRYVPNRD